MSGSRTCFSLGRGSLIFSFASLGSVALVARDMRTDQELQPLAVAKLLAKIVEKENCKRCHGCHDMPKIRKSCCSRLKSVVGSCGILTADSLQETPSVVLLGKQAARSWRLITDARSFMRHACQVFFRFTGFRGKHRFYNNA